MKGRLHQLALAMIAAIGQARLEPKVPVPVFRGATPKRRRATKTSYGQGLLNQWSRQAREAMPKHGQRDEHGAFTLVGNNPFAPRRKWLAGVSAQRGY